MVQFRSGPSSSSGSSVFPKTFDSPATTGETGSASATDRKAGQGKSRAETTVSAQSSGVGTGSARGGYCRVSYLVVLIIQTTERTFIWAVDGRHHTRWRGEERLGSDDTAVEKVVVENGFSDNGKGEFDVVGVRGLGNVGYQVQVGPVELLETPKNVLDRLVHVGAPHVVWEVLLHRRMRELLDEDIDLVQAENDCSSSEPHRVDNRLEKIQ